MLSNTANLFLDFLEIIIINKILPITCKQWNTGSQTTETFKKLNFSHHVSGEVKAQVIFIFCHVKLKCNIASSTMAESSL